MKLLELVNEIKVVPRTLKFLKAPFYIDVSDGEESGYDGDVELITYQQLVSDLNTYSKNERVVICKSDIESDKNQSVRTILCLPLGYYHLGPTLDNEDLPDGISISGECTDFYYYGFVYIATTSTLDSDLNSIIGDPSDVIDYSDFWGESGISPQQALQYLKGVHI